MMIKYTNRCGWRLRRARRSDRSGEICTGFRYGFIPLVGPDKINTGNLGRLIELRAGEARAARSAAEHGVCIRTPHPGLGRDDPDRVSEDREALVEVRLVYDKRGNEPTGLVHARRQR